MLVVTNRSGRALNLTNRTAHHCTPKFEVVLTNAELPALAPFTLECSLAPFTLRPGTNRFSFSLATSYSSCVADNTGHPDWPVCLASGIPPVPAGGYHAVLVGSGELALPAPKPIRITVIAS